jgi:hypothetical protein
MFTALSTAVYKPHSPPPVCADAYSPHNPAFLASVKMFITSPAKFRSLSCLRPSTRNSHPLHRHSGTHPQTFTSRYPFRMHLTHSIHTTHRTYSYSCCSYFLITQHIQKKRYAPSQNNSGVHFKYQLQQVTIGKCRYAGRRNGRTGLPLQKIHPTGNRSDTWRRGMEEHNGDVVLRSGGGRLRKKRIPMSGIDRAKKVEEFTTRHITQRSLEYKCVSGCPEELLDAEMAFMTNREPLLQCDVMALWRSHDERNTQLFE